MSKINDISGGRHLNAITFNKNLNPIERNLAHAFASSLNPKTNFRGWKELSIAQFEYRTGHSRSTIKRHLSTLIEKGYFNLDQLMGAGRNKYQLAEKLFSEYVENHPRNVEVEIPEVHNGNGVTVNLHNGNGVRENLGGGSERTHSIPSCDNPTKEEKEKSEEKKWIEPPKNDKEQRERELAQDKKKLSDKAQEIGNQKFLETQAEITNHENGKSHTTQYIREIKPKDVATSLKLINDNLPSKKDDPTSWSGRPKMARRLVGLYGIQLLHSFWEWSMEQRKKENGGKPKLLKIYLEKLPPLVEDYYNTAYCTQEETGCPQ